MSPCSATSRGPGIEAAPRKGVGAFQRPARFWVGSCRAGKPPMSKAITLVLVCGLAGSVIAYGFVSDNYPRQRHRHRNKAMLCLETRRLAPYWPPRQGRGGLLPVLELLREPNVRLRRRSSSYRQPRSGTLSRRPTPMPGDRGSLAEDLQRELARVGCYDGQINGVWTTSTRQAMKAFLERVNATLPITQPDGVLLALVQGQRVEDLRHVMSVGSDPHRRWPLHANRHPFARGPEGSSEEGDRSRLRLGPPQLPWRPSCRLHRLKDEWRWLAPKPRALRTWSRPHRCNPRVPVLRQHVTAAGIGDPSFGRGNKWVADSFRSASLWMVAKKGRPAFVGLQPEAEVRSRAPAQARGWGSGRAIPKTERRLRSSTASAIIVGSRLPVTRKELPGGGGVRERSTRSADTSAELENPATVKITAGGNNKTLLTGLSLPEGTCWLPLCLPHWMPCRSASAADSIEGPGAWRLMLVQS